MDVFFSMLVGLFCLVMPVGIIVLVVVLIQYNAKKARERREDREHWARQLGLRFRAGDDPELGEMLVAFKLSGKGHSRRISNVIQGEIQRREVNVFDYEYTVGAGEDSTTYYLVGVLLIDPDLDVPHHRVASRSFLDGMRLWSDAEEFQLGHREFDGRFRLAGRDRGRIDHLFNRDVVEFHLDNPMLQTEGYADRLLVYRVRTSNPGDDRRLLKEAVCLLELMRRPSQEKVSGQE